MGILVQDRKKLSPFERAIRERLVERYAEAFAVEYGKPESADSIERGKTGRRFNTTPDWMPAFLEALTVGHTVEKASTLAGVHSSVAYRVRKNNEEFRKAWNEATDLGTRLLEQEASRRAYHGTNKPVFHNGVKCGEVKEYSDTLMIFLLKSRKPEKYRDHHGASTVNVSIQTNIAAVDTIRKMVQDGRLSGPEEITPLNITSTSSDGGFGGQVDTGPPLTDDEQGTDEGMEDT